MDSRRLSRQRFIRDGFYRSDLETGPDKGRQEAVKLHVRESRHAPPAGNRADTGNHVRIVVKCFVEIPHAQ